MGSTKRDFLRSGLTIGSALGLGALGLKLRSGEDLDFSEGFIEKDAHQDIAKTFADQLGETDSYIFDSEDVGESGIKFESGPKVIFDYKGSFEGLDESYDMAVEKAAYMLERLHVAAEQNSDFESIECGIQFNDGGIASVTTEEFENEYSDFEHYEFGEEPEDIYKEAVREEYSEEEYFISAEGTGEAI